MSASGAAELGDAVDGAGEEVTDVAPGDRVGEADGVVEPHAATITASSRPAAAPAGFDVLILTGPIRVTRQWYRRKWRPPLSRTGAATRNRGFGRSFGPGFLVDS